MLQNRIIGMLSIIDNMDVNWISTTELSQITEQNESEDMDINGR